MPLPPRPDIQWGRPPSCHWLFGSMGCGWRKKLRSLDRSVSLLHGQTLGIPPGDITGLFFQRLSNLWRGNTALWTNRIHIRASEVDGVVYNFPLQFHSHGACVHAWQYHHISHPTPQGGLSSHTTNYHTTLWIPTESDSSCSSGLQLANHMLHTTEVFLT